MPIFAVGTKILGGAGQHWGPVPPGPNVEPPLLMTNSINWPITVRSAVPFRKLYLPISIENRKIGNEHARYNVTTHPQVVSLK